MSATSTVQATPRLLPSAAPRRRMWRKLRETAFWYLLLSPSLLVIFGFSIVPMLWSVYYSFTKGGMLGKHTFIGIQNYIRASGHPIFLQTLQNTTLYAVMTVPTVIVLSLIVAIIIFQLPKMQGFFRGTVYFPLITPVVIAANIWAYIVNRDFGPMNHILSWFGVPRIDWPSNCDDGDLARLWFLCHHPLCRLAVNPQRALRSRPYRWGAQSTHYLEHYHPIIASSAGLLFHHGDDL